MLPIARCRLVVDLKTYRYMLVNMYDIMVNCTDTQQQQQEKLFLIPYSGYRNEDVFNAMHAPKRKGGS